MNKLVCSFPFENFVRFCVVPSHYGLGKEHLGAALLTCALLTIDLLCDLNLIQLATTTVAY